MTYTEIVRMVRASIDSHLRETLSSPPKSYGEFKKRVIDAVSTTSSDHVELFAVEIHESDDFYDVWVNIESELFQEDPKDRCASWNRLVEDYIREAVETHSRESINVDAVMQRLKLV